MDIHSVIEFFAEAWVAANTQSPLTEASAAGDSLSMGEAGNSIFSGRPSIPIRCLIERQECFGDGKSVALQEGGQSASSSDHQRSSSPLQTSSPSRLEQDTFAIIPSYIPFQELVKTALVKLGYSYSEAIGARGLIQLRNWKAFTLDQITDSPDATVSEVLGEISSFVTLRIRLFKPKGSAAHEVKDKLLQILLAHSQNLLANSGCPVDQYRSSIHSPNGGHANGQSFVPYAMSGPITNGSTNGNHKSPSPSVTESPEGDARRIRRSRTFIDPTTEIPRLEHWFATNTHPTHSQIVKYTEELNRLQYRQKFPKLEPKNIQFWFKNRRAKFKRLSPTTLVPKDQSIKSMDVIVSSAHQQQQNQQQQ